MEKQKVDWSQFRDADDPTDEEINVLVWGMKGINITPAPTDREMLVDGFGYDTEALDTLTDAECEKLMDERIGWIDNDD